MKKMKLNFAVTIENNTAIITTDLCKDAVLRMHEKNLHEYMRELSNTARNENSEIEWRVIFKD